MDLAVITILLIWAIATVYLITIAYKYKTAKEELAERRAGNDRLRRYIHSLGSQPPKKVYKQL